MPSSSCGRAMVGSRREDNPAEQTIAFSAGPAGANLKIDKEQQPLTRSSSPVCCPANFHGAELAGCRYVGRFTAFANLVHSAAVLPGVLRGLLVADRV